MLQNKRAVTVVCSDQPGSVAKVAERLRDIGFDVEQELEFAGSVIGQWGDDLTILEKIPGVLAAEESEEKYPLG